MNENAPKRLWRVTWMAALGYPTPDKRRRVARNYTSAEYAARQVAVIEAMPSHLKLLSVQVTDCEWSPVELDELPTPAPIDELEPTATAMEE